MAAITQQTAPKTKVTTPDPVTAPRTKVAAPVPTPQVVKPLEPPPTVIPSKTATARPKTPNPTPATVTAPKPKTVPAAAPVYAPQTNRGGVYS
jgi:hypothetical protein